MQRKALRFGTGFRITLGNHRSQSAEMTLAPGDSVGGPDNRHRGSDQWLFVVSGTGKAIVNGRTSQIRKGTLLLIERGEWHEIRCSGRAPLRTLNFYVPPAYDANEEPLPAGRS